jgi:hypothetical protein
VRTNALVVEAGPPVDNIPPMGNLGRGIVRVLVSEPQPVYTARELKLDEDHWLVPGMEVPLEIDPARPDEFEIDWAAIPPIEQRAAANDPTLADPGAAEAKAIAALRSSGLAGLDPAALPAGMSEVVAGVQQAQAGATPDRFAEAMNNAARAEAPPGQTRAVVLIATSTASLRFFGQDASRWELVSHGRRKAVLAVNIPGRAPYASYQPEFERPEGQRDLIDAGLPALVSASDPHDIEVLWEEQASLGDQLSQRLSDSFQSAAAGMQAEQQFMQGALGGDVQQQMADSAMRVLQAITDPAQRQMMINQYRAAGIEIDESQLGP